MTTLEMQASHDRLSGHEVRGGLPSIPESFMVRGNDLAMSFFTLAACDVSLTRRAFARPNRCP